MDWIDAIIGVSDAISANRPAPTPKPLWFPGKPSLDIVVPHRGDIILRGLNSSKPVSSGLIITLMSCENALKDSGLTRKYHIVANCIPETGAEREGLNAALEYIDKKGRVGQFFDVQYPLSPGSARNLGASAGDADLLCFFDNHCTVDSHYFSSAVQTFESTGADAAHGVIFMDRTPTYHYGLFLEEGFWGRPQPFPPISLLPFALASKALNDGRSPTYPIASAGHGAFVIKRSVFNEVGQYWDGFEGFGAEETYLDLKLAMLDKKIVLDLNMKHEHQERMQVYKVPANFLENNLMAANILGGYTWAEKNAVSFRVRNRLEGGEDKKFYDSMLRRAMERSQPRADWLAARRKRTLEQQLTQFKLEHIAGALDEVQAAERVARGLFNVLGAYREQYEQLNEKLRQ